MPNPYFQFKQFVVYQDQCAMKVCTDACILGAWFAEKTPSYSLVLDIGSGTGLLMLMLAQKHKGEIQGIELDLAAFRQLKENITRSKWKDELRVFPGDVRSYVFPHKFDFIIANPPFFEGDLPATSDAANLAKHSSELTLAELLEVIDVNLESAGSFGILLPYHRVDYFIGLAAGRGFFLREKLLVRQTPKHDFFRGVLHFARRQDTYVPTTELCIKNEGGVDTEEFVELMKDYYLYL
ncbi:MAG TPA: methyltransferase [Puia sp.]|nr:methyltransferase [Puia sp.]